MLPQKILKFRSSEMRPKWPPSLFNQPRGNSLGARLNFIMIPLKMAERSSISCDPSRYRNHVDIIMLYSKLLKARVRYILSDLFQLKNG